MTVNYRHATGDTVLCHGLGHPGEAGYFTGPLGASDETETEWAAEYGKPIGANDAVPYDRGCAQHAFGLLVERRFASDDEARAFAIGFAGTLPRGGVALEIEQTLTWLVRFESAVLAKVSVRRIGCSCDVDFSFMTSVPVSVAVATASPLTGGTVGVAYSVELDASGGTSYTWGKLSGDLPPGLTLSIGGVLSGMPTTPGTFTFFVKAIDASGAYGTKTMTVTIAGA